MILSHARLPIPTLPQPIDYTFIGLLMWNLKQRKYFDFDGYRRLV